MIEEAKAVAQRLHETSFSNDWRTFIKAADTIDALVAEVERLKAKEERYTLVDTALKNEVEEMRQEVERLKQACDKFSESEMLLKQEQAEPVKYAVDVESAYNMLDRFLRNNLDDEGYEEFSSALGTVAFDNGQTAMLRQALEAMSDIRYVSDYTHIVALCESIKQHLGEA